MKLDDQDGRGGNRGGDQGRTHDTGRSSGVDSDKTRGGGSQDSGRSRNHDEEERSGRSIDRENTASGPGGGARQGREDHSAPESGPAGRNSDGIIDRDEQGQFARRS